MNQREARRLAVRRLAAVARQYVDGDELIAIDGRPLKRRDAQRVEQAFAQLAAELEQRAGDRPRGPRPESVDPNQCTIFDEE